MVLVGWRKTREVCYGSAPWTEPTKLYFLSSSGGMVEQEYNIIQNTCDGPGPLHISSDLTLTN
jgi:hypothetical protein